MTRSWWDNEDIIRQFRDWLTQTAEEVDALDEGSQLASDDESAMPDPDVRDLPAADLPDIGLLQLVEAFTAMRHELKLQTKGTRNLEASVDRSLTGLESASQTFQSIQAKEEEAAERVAVPLVEALIGLDEGLLRAAEAFQATHRQMTHSTPARLRERLDEQFQNQSWWRRLMTRRWHAHVCESATKALSQSTNQEFAGLMQGFALIQTRLSRALSDLGIRRLDAPGGQVDPTQMTVVDLVHDANLPAETVIEVVRPGYAWGERVVRFAEVKAVASRSSPPDYDQNQWDDDGTNDVTERIRGDKAINQ